MDLNELPKMFNRALKGAFRWKKFLTVASVFLLAGVIYLFFEAVAIHTSSWLRWPLRCLPLFFLVGFLMGTGVFLERLYTQEQKGESPALRKTLLESWEGIVKGSYYALPLLFTYLLCWILLGVFMLLMAIPYLGTFLGIVLAFAPSILNLTMLLLFFVGVLLFFFVTPSLAHKGYVERKALLKGLSADLFTTCLLFGVAFVPSWVVWKLAQGAAVLTLNLYPQDGGSLELILQDFFMLLPLIAVAVPAVIFFFNFAAEAHPLVCGSEDHQEGISHHP